MMERDPRLRSELAAFLVRAKRATNAATASAPDAAASRPGARDLRYEEAEGGWSYLVSDLGGPRFAGQEVVWKDGAPVWAMNYCGMVTGEGFDSGFRREALRAVPEDAPYRGPIEYQRDDMLYVNNYAGELPWFFGREEIYRKGVSIYTCMYHGGAVEEA